MPWYWNPQDQSGLQLSTDLAEEGVRSAVEVPLLVARLSAGDVTEGVDDLVGVDQILVGRLRREVALALL